MRSDLTQKRLKALLIYNPATGVMINRVTRNPRAKIGEIAGAATGNEKRWYIQIDGVRYSRSRLAVLYMTGRWPPHEVDHLNHDRLDDRWRNLWLATRSENGCNRRVQSNNKIGVKGIQFDKRCTNKPYCARVGKNGRTVFWKNFPTLEEAIAAHRQAVLKYHGEFAEFG
jgi:hypothetical protein